MMVMEVTYHTINGFRHYKIWRYIQYTVIIIIVYNNTVIIIIVCIPID